MFASADKLWYFIKIDGGPEFDVYSFSGQEGVSSLYFYDVELVYDSENAPIKELIGKNACLTIKDKFKESRYVHGVVREIRQLHTGNKRTHYRCTIVPRLWFLTETRDHRIYQDKTVVDIITDLLIEQGFSGDSFSFAKCTPPPEREYCVQYHESDYYFISRLCEEEGIYFFFEHTSSHHRILFSNLPGSAHAALPGGLPTFEFNPGSGSVHNASVISRLTLNHKASSNKSTYREWDFTQAKVNLEVTKELPPGGLPPLPSKINFDVYQYPHLYRTPDEGERYVDIQTLRQASMHTWIDIMTDSCRFTPGFQFVILGHKRRELNVSWWILALAQNGEQPQVLGHEAPEYGQSYSAIVTALPVDTRFIPELNHPKNRIVGQQAAIVTGEGDEEIYPDEHGRVKVQFFWDREGKWDEKTTCWIRVAHGWAGGQYGTMAIPRVGHEVLVSFLEGDPDRPIITGRVYHELNQAPYALPDNKTRTVFKSYSSPSKEKKGFNELRIEDKANAEEIYVHGEKDANVYIKKDWADMICANRSNTTGGDHMVKTGGKTSYDLADDRMVRLKKNDHLKIEGSRLTRIDGLDDTSVDALNLWSDSTIMIEAGEAIVLKVGGSFISITGGEITIHAGKILENCEESVPEWASPEAPTEPEPPKGVDKGSIPNGGEMAKPMPPLEPEQQEGGEEEAAAEDEAAERSIAPPIENFSDDTTFVEFQLLNERDEPISNEEYIITLADGSKKKGLLDSNGFVRMDDVPRGKCDIRFPNLEECVEVE
ncbi:MAG: type VI secretion system tip protein VgrG [Desulfovibrio sp.]|jgi:type VI secretion system secreted protein VgrG|nr:type VI secretion system tip protein VgrG [Desulfovibrio sp.]